MRLLQSVFAIIGIYAVLLAAFFYGVMKEAKEMREAAKAGRPYFLIGMGDVRIIPLKGEVKDADAD